MAELKLSLYVLYVTRFVNLWKRLPSIDEQRRAREDYIEDRQPEQKYSLYDIFAQKNKTPCEICDDYFAWQMSKRSSEFMHGTFPNKAQADIQTVVDVILYVPAAPTRFTTVADKLSEAVQWTATTHQELVHQIDLYNYFERPNAPAIDPEQFALQLLSQNGEFAVRLNVEYQYTLFRRMLAGTSYNLALNSSGQPDQFFMVRFVLPKNRQSNMAVECESLDRYVRAVENYTSTPRQHGVFPLDLYFGDWHFALEKELETNVQKQYSTLVDQLEKLTVDELILIQTARSRQQLVSALRQGFKAWYGTSGNRIQAKQIVTLLRALSSPEAAIIPYVDKGQFYTDEAKSKKGLPGSLDGRRLLIPYLELPTYQGNICTLTSKDVEQQIQEVFKK